MKFEDMKVKDILADKDLMAVIKEFIPDWEKYPVKLIQNKKVSDVIAIAKKQGLCTDEDVKQLKTKMDAVLAKKNKK